MPPDTVTDACASRARSLAIQINWPPVLPNRQASTQVRFADLNFVHGPAWLKTDTSLNRL
jgi:hypothetical protein